MSMRSGFALVALAVGVSSSIVSAQQCPHVEPLCALPAGVAPSALAAHDPDGPGPLPSELFIGGQFSFSLTPGGPLERNIVRCDGTTLHSAAGGLNGPVYALTVYDPDGPGPLPRSIVAGGDFWLNPTTLGGPLGRVARWTGTEWAPLGSIPSGPEEIGSMVEHDPDGHGPELPNLFVGGRGSSFSRGVWRYSNGTWLQATIVQNPPLGVHTFAVNDPDGPGGPVVGRLYAYDQNNVYVWHGGVAWSLVATNLHANGSIVSFDEDGQGPGVPRLHLRGNLTSLGNTFVRLSDAGFEPLMRFLPTGTNSLSFAPGGNAEPLLLLPVSFTSTVVGVPAPSMMIWDGRVLRPMGSGLLPEGSSTARPPSAITTWDRDGEGPDPARIILAGNFGSANGVAVGGLASYLPGQSFDIAPPPEAISRRAGTALVLSAPATGTGPFEHRWHRNGVALSDGDLAGRVSGAATDTLRIREVQRTDAAEFTVRITSAAPCELPAVVPTRLTVFCAGDFNLSGGPPTVQDVYDYITAWLAGDPSADTDESGTPTVQDIFDFLEEWSAPCA